MAEIVRAGIGAVDEGQTEAAQALGMSRGAAAAPGRAPAGDAGDHPADRQRVHQHAQDQRRWPRSSSTPSCSSPCQSIYTQQPADHRAAVRGRPLVPGAHQRLQRRAVLPGAALRPRLQPRRCHPRRGSGVRANLRYGATADDRADGARRERAQELRPARGAARASTSRSSPGRCAACSGRPVRASRRSCGASTTSRRSTAAGCRSTASWSATGSRATSSTSSRRRRPPPSAPRSAWSSSASTCSRT